MSNLIPSWPRSGTGSATVSLFRSGRPSERFDFADLDAAVDYACDKLADCCCVVVATYEQFI